MKNQNEFVMEQYGKKSVFSSFLPGISGEKGIPIWCYYVNRGQGVVSFGVGDKDHSIMEFYPAHQAYQNVKTTGFRTFIKKDGTYFEPFSNEDNAHQMNIQMNSFGILETDKANGLKTEVLYTTLPTENVGGLVRKVTFTNIGDKATSMEVLDGMPAIVPYDIGLEALKTMGQTVKAWMEVEDLDSRVPYFKARSSSDDTATVTPVIGGNYSMCITADGERLPAIVDPAVVFEFDNSMSKAYGLKDGSLETMYAKSQVTANQYPCSFFGTKVELASGESYTMYQVIGQVDNKEVLGDFLDQKFDAEFFAKKEAITETLTENLCEVIHTKTANKDFDAYCKYTYMDNVLRGGYPIKFPGNKIFYVYSRKHGDIERDYNYFRMLPEYFSQGNGNFRDVNQNRRMDNFFTPYVEQENMNKFYSMIQLDGYNPLAVEKVTYTLDEASAKEALAELSKEQQEVMVAYVTKEFAPGGFYKELYDIGVKDSEVQDALFAEVIENASENFNCDFGEGYWSDHWTYNLDLVENFLAVNPEKKNSVLLDETYTYYATHVPILPRVERYVETANGVRQYNYLNEENARHDAEKLVRANFGKGDVVKVSLLEKLMVLNTTKFAALDAYGMGVEMEGGKPGWYDALNGLPGLFGSSMAEVYELKRNLMFTLEVLKEQEGNVSLTKEFLAYVQAMAGIASKYAADMKDGQCMEFWNERNEVKEAYVKASFAGITGEKAVVEVSALVNAVTDMLVIVSQGIDKAIKLVGGIVPTYFAFELEEYEVVEAGIVAKSFKPIVVPSFLEGPVRYYKLGLSKEEKKALYTRVKNSDLYDKKLKMYKVNESLKDASFELGRAKAFTPGWLENESIWLHMEYKYLLELIKCELYEEFLEDFQNAAVPFLDPEVYGRSIYENSSFIASSSNPNPAYHGKGFVARLSGSTVEFLQIWKLMMFGADNFVACGDELSLKFAPTVPKGFIGEDLSVEAVFLGQTLVKYNFAEQKDYIPGEYELVSTVLTYNDGRVVETSDRVLSNELALAVKAGEIKEITMSLK